MISLDSPLLVGNERKYLNECIDTNWISWQGKFVNLLEKEIADYCHTQFGVSIVNGTYALILALKALGVGEGDEVIVPTFTMSATPFAVTSVGATVVWADCSPGSLNAEADQIKEKITNKTKAIIAVHLYGTACDVQGIKNVAGCVPVIEDAAESFGAKINGQYVGGIGDMACHSFHNKIIATGEGGAVTLNNQKLFNKLKELRTPAENNAGGNILSINNRMSNITASLALAQLEKVDYLIDNRRRVASIYDNAFKNNIHIIEEKSNQKNVYWRYQIFVDESIRDQLVENLKIKGIESRPVFSPMHRYPLYDSKEIFKNASRLSSTGIDIPTSPSLTTPQAEYVAETILNEVRKLS